MEEKKKLTLMAMLVNWLIKHFWYNGQVRHRNLRPKSSVGKEVCFICSYTILADLYQLRSLAVCAGTILISKLA